MPTAPEGARGTECWMSTDELPMCATNCTALALTQLPSCQYEISLSVRPSVTGKLAPGAICPVLTKFFRIGHGWPPTPTNSRYSCTVCLAARFPVFVTSTVTQYANFAH